MKKINICGKEYPIDCNAFTFIEFKKKFKDNGIFKDFQIINDFTTMQVMLTAKLKEKNPNITTAQIIKEVSNEMLQYMDDFVGAITRVGYICCYTANPDIGEYEDWLKEIKKINTNDMWIVEVTEFAVDNFCGLEGTE